MSFVGRRAAVLASSLLLSVLVPTGAVSAATRPAPAPVKKAATAGGVKKASVPTLASRLAAVTAARTINYYPSNAGWSAMWTRFDAVKIEADLAKAKALGADNVRVIVFPAAFGYPAPKSNYAAKLAKFVSIADGEGLTVKLTLFDWWTGYPDTAGSAAWAKAVLAPYA